MPPKVSRGQASVVPTQTQQAGKNGKKGKIVANRATATVIQKTETPDPSMTAATTVLQSASTPSSPSTSSPPLSRRTTVIAPIPVPTTLPDSNPAEGPSSSNSVPTTVPSEPIFDEEGTALMGKLTPKTALDAKDAQKLLHFLNGRKNEVITQVFHHLCSVNLKTFFELVVAEKENNQTKTTLEKIQNLALSELFPSITIEDPTLFTNNPILKTFLPHLRPSKIKEALERLSEEFIQREENRRIAVAQPLQPSFKPPTSTETEINKMKTQELIAGAKIPALSIQNLEQDGIYQLSGENYKNWIQRRQNLASIYLDRIRTSAMAYLASTSLDELIPLITSMRWRHLAVVIPMLPEETFVNVAYRCFETAAREIATKKRIPPILHSTCLKNPLATKHNIAESDIDQELVLQLATLEQKNAFVASLNEEKIQKLQRWKVKRKWISESLAHGDSSPELVNFFNRQWAPGTSSR